MAGIVILMRPVIGRTTENIIILFLDSNIARLITFKRKALKHKLSFSIYCFPHQVSFLQEFFGEKVNLIQISLESVEELLEVDSCFDKQ